MAIEKTLAVAGTMALAVALSAPARAAECGCAADRPQHAVGALPSYTSAFAGRVTDVAEAGTDRKVTFQVFRAWKGPRDKTLHVVTPAGECGVPFERGADYVVYSTGKKDALRTDGCSLTAPLTGSARAIRQLDLHAGYGSNPLRVPAPSKVEARQ